MVLCFAKLLQLQVIPLRTLQYALSALLFTGSSQPLKQGIFPIAFDIFAYISSFLQETAGSSSKSFS